MWEETHFCELHTKAKRTDLPTPQTTAMNLRHMVYGAPVGLRTYGVALLASIGGFLFGWYVFRASSES